MAGDFGDEPLGDVQEIAQLVGGRGKPAGMVVARAAQVGPVLDTGQHLAGTVGVIE